MLEPQVAQALAASGERIVVTGAGGWIGRATLDLLAAALGDGFDARVRCFGSAERTLPLADGRSVRQAPLGEIATLAPCPSTVLHFAFLTKDRAAAMPAEAYERACAAITATVVGALDAIGARRAFVASSGAAARADDPHAPPDLARYGRLKRDEEDAFAAWAEASGRRAVIARIFNIAGPHINKLGSYALASFILDALAGHAITVRAPRAVVRGYVAIRELISLALALLADGDRGVVRFETGGAPMELAAVAGAVAQALGGGPVERAAIIEPVPDRYVGDAAPYAALLARYGIAAVPLDAQIRETADFLRLARVRTGPTPAD